MKPRCIVCGGDLQYCEECEAYHHVFNYEEEHEDKIKFDREGNRQ